MIKSEEEIALIREGARIADLDAEAIEQAVKPETREIDVAMAGRNAFQGRRFMTQYVSDNAPDSR